ncbi:5159_t:CDS:2 [Rhizophagus irregularis]|nr:5159_t:CDS:2 [Rhizophagus irregularis]
MELEENQEIVLWGWGWEEIGLTLLIHMVLANRTNPLMKKKMAGSSFCSNSCRINENKIVKGHLEALVKLAELSITGGKLFIVPLYGISQDPDTENFILVFKYIESNFHYYYRTQEFNQLILGTKLTCIWEICMSLDNSKLDYKTIEDVYSTFVSLSLDSRSQANYKSRLLDLPNLSELESELASDSMQISTGSDQWRFQFINPGNPFKGEYPRIAPFLLTHGCKTTSELLEPYKDKVQRVHTDGFILEEQPNSPALITCSENASKTLKALKFETAGYCHVKNANKII